MISVTTRFYLRYFWEFIPLYLSYRSMKKELRAAPGLIRYAFLMQNPMTCFTFSIWESEEALIQFSNAPSHVSAVRHAKRICRSIWSAYWHIDAISKHAREWSGPVTFPPVRPFLPHDMISKIKKGAE